MTEQKLTKCIHWLAGSFPVEFLPVVRSMVTHLVGHVGEDRDFGSDFYKRSTKWECGAVLQWSPDRPEAHLSLNGAAVDLIPADQQLKLVVDLADLFFRCSRIDLAADDYTRQLFPLDLIHAAGDAYNFTGPRTYRKVTQKQKGQLTGNTAYFGSRQSNTYARFYDKALETKGKTNCIRFEVEYKNKAAPLVFEALSSSSSLESFTRKIGSHLTCCLQFIDRTPDAHNHLDRMQRLGWWVKIIEVLDQATITIQHVVPPLQKTLLHLRHQYRKILGLASIVVAETGHEFGEILLKWMKEGESIMKGKRTGARQLGVDVCALLGITDQLHV